jgi:hypothetical protein
MKEVLRPLVVPTSSTPGVPRVRALDVSLEPERSLVRLRGHPSNYNYVKDMVKDMIRSLIEKQVTRINLLPELTRMLGLDSHAATTLRLKQLTADTGCQSCTLKEPDYSASEKSWECRPYLTQMPGGADRMPGFFPLSGIILPDFLPGT